MNSKISLWMRQYSRICCLLSSMLPNQVIYRNPNTACTYSHSCIAVQCKSQIAGLLL
jgi:hypothetical protein